MLSPLWFRLCRLRVGAGVAPSGGLGQGGDHERGEGLEAFGSCDGPALSLNHCQGTLAALTFLLPASPALSDVVEISFLNLVTALVVQARNLIQLPGRGKVLLESINHTTASLINLMPLPISSKPLRHLPLTLARHVHLH